MEDILQTITQQLREIQVTLVSTNETLSKLQAEIARQGRLLVEHESKINDLSRIVDRRDDEYVGDRRENPIVVLNIRR